MLCALTVRTLKPETFEQFREAFMQSEDADNPPPGFVRFDMIRNTENPDEVICFGFFDGTVDELRRVAAEQDYAGQLEAIAPFVESVGADGLYEVVEEYTGDSRAAG
jgi:heme-degrading monooxygenase HmoA